jgi:hypothetical protein
MFKERIFFLIKVEKRNHSLITYRVRVLILTSGRTRQFMKLFSITFCKIRKSFPRFFAPQFLPNE